MTVLRTILIFYSNERSLFLSPSSRQFFFLRLCLAEFAGGEVFSPRSRT